MATPVTLIRGDGQGRTLVEPTQRLIAAAGAHIDWEEVPAGLESFKRDGEALPREAVDSIRRNRVALQGRLLTPVGEGYQSPSVRLRQELGLFAAVRPIQSLRGLHSRYEGVDLVIIRETTEDVYAGIEHQVVPGVIQSLKVTTAMACRRIVRFTFEYARRYRRQQVTLVHKANIMKKSDGLFMRCGAEVAARYPEITFNTIIADNACMQLVRDPHRFDVLVCQNLFGDLLSDLGAGLVGGISAVWSVLRDESDLHVFEAIHSTVPELEARGLANPLTFIRPAVRMLRHLGEEEAAARIQRAVSHTLGDGIATMDLGGRASSGEFFQAAMARLDLPPRATAR